MDCDPQQTNLDFPGAEVDARSAFRARMTRLREDLKRVPAGAVGLSSLRWQQVREFVMAVRSYELAGGRPELGKMFATSGLSRDQWYVAREQAGKLGLVLASRSYLGAHRQPDRLMVDVAAVEALARPGPTKSDQVRPSPTKSDQVRPSPNSSARLTNPRASEPKNQRTKNSSSSSFKPIEPEEEEEEEDFHARWRRVIPIANHLLRLVAPGGLSSAGRERREWIIKVALLADRFGADWIDPAFEQLKYCQSHSPQGLLATILDDECQRRGTRLHRELARVRLPTDFVSRLSCGRGAT